MAFMIVAVDGHRIPPGLSLRIAMMGVVSSTLIGWAPKAAEVFFTLNTPPPPSKQSNRGVQLEHGRGGDMYIYRERNI